MQEAEGSLGEDVMDTTCEIIDAGNHLVVVNRNPARRNALTPAFYAGLTDATARAGREARIGAVVVTGAEGFFCAGGDLNFLMTAQGMPLAARRARIEELAAVVRAIRGCPRPVIAAVEGGAAGAGFSLALACDMLVAAQGAQFTAAYVNAGLVPDGGLTAALVARLPPNLAAEICLLGRPIAAERLHALGAVNLLTEAGGALDAAQDIARRLAAGPAAAQTAIKRLLTGAADALWQGQLAAETDAMAEALAAPEAAEGIAAFLGKRAPAFAAMRRG
jgi:enoyl-CoA hydratase/carnithine racemase